MWRVAKWMMQCDKRQTTNDRLAYNYNNVDADDDEVQPETGKEAERGGGDREQTP